MNKYFMILGLTLLSLLTAELLLLLILEDLPLLLSVCDWTWKLK